MSIKSRWNKLAMRVPLFKLLTEFSDWHDEQQMEKLREKYRERSRQRHGRIDETDAQRAERLERELGEARWQLQLALDYNENLVKETLALDMLKEEVDNYLLAEGVDKPWQYDLVWRLKLFEDISKAHRKERSKDD